jgi:hypothetical protein
MSVLMRRTKVVELVMHLNENARRKRTLWIDRYVDGERLMDPRGTSARLPSDHDLNSEYLKKG